MADTGTSIESIYQELEPLKAKLSEHTKHREELFSQREQIRKQFETKLTELRNLKRKRDELNRAVREKKEVRQKLTEQIRALIDTLNKAKTQKEGHSVKSKEENPSFLKAQLKKLETKVETEANSPDEEKKLMKRIKELKKKLADMKEFLDASASVSSSVHDLKKIKREADEVHKAIQDTAKESQVVHEQLTAVGKDLDDLKPKEAQISESITKVKEEISAVMKAMDDKNSKIRGVKEVEFAEKEKSRKETERDNEALLQQKETDVEDKIKRGKKLTTDDLLVFQRTNKE